MIKNKTTWRNMINKKAVKTSNFIWSTYPLVMLHTQFLILSLHVTTLHPATLHSTSLHFSTLHFFPFKFHPATLHYPLIWLNPIKFPTTPFHLTSLHFTSLHFTSLHFTFRWFSPRLYSSHFTPFIIALLNLFLKILGLQGKVPDVPAGSWFQFLMVLFTKECFPISDFCFMSLIFRTWSTLLT